MLFCVKIHILLLHSLTSSEIVLVEGYNVPAKQKKSIFVIIFGS